MIKDSPLVVVNFNFTQPTNKKYIKNKINGMYNYFTKEEKRAIDMFDYYNGTIKHEEKKNLVLENGSYATKEEIEKRKKQYLKYIEKSNLWRGVISFNNDYIDENIEIKRLEQLLAKKIIPKFLKKCGFVDIKNMSYQLSFHNDTDNYHFHFSFIEKKPNYSSSNNNLCYRKKGKISEKEQIFLKNQIVIEISKRKELSKMITNTNLEIEKLKQYFKSNQMNYILKYDKNLLLEYELFQLGSMLHNYKKYNGKIKYNSINDKDIKKVTNKIYKLLLKSDSNLKKDYNNFCSSLDKLNEFYDNLSFLNHEKNINNTYTKSKKAYLENYIFNAIVNHAYYDYFNKKKTKIKSIEIFNSIISTKCRKHSKYDIINNYLKSGSCINKNNIEKAIKNVNNEMEEATNEFSKLFNYDRTH